MMGYKGPDYKALSEEAVLHQVRINSLNLYCLIFLMLLFIRLWLCGMAIGQSTF